MRTELPAGTRIVRFAENGIVRLALRGNWWMRWADYAQVERLADVRGLSVADAVRATCCVPLEWNAMDLVVQAVLGQPLLAYGGYGRRADAASGSIAPMPGLTGTPLFQLYIPGLADNDLQHDVIRFEGAGHLPSAKVYPVSRVGAPAA